VDGDDAQPANDRVALGLGAQEDGPGRLAGISDELAPSVHGVCDGALEVAVM
jgi:hypothetical protein